MDEGYEEKAQKKSKIRFSQSKLKFDKKFVFIAVFLIISVMAISFSTYNLFKTEIVGWEQTYGTFVGESGYLISKSPDWNWMFHESKVAYGRWEWNVKTTTAGAASIIFIGNDQNADYYEYCQRGYKLVFDTSENLAITKVTGFQSETIINSTSISPVSGTNYHIIITRTTELFTVQMNGEEVLTAEDNSITTSEVLQLDWFSQNELEYIKVIDSVTEENSWSDYFTGLPNATSDNVFTKIALYIPFVTLGLVILFYIFRLLFADGSWTKFLVPLALAAIIGVGYGLLLNYLRQLAIQNSGLPTGTDPPNTSDIPTTPDPTPGNETTPDPSNTTLPSGGVGFNFGQTPISIALLIISGVFVLVTVAFVVFDFYKKRDEEYHEDTKDVDARWLPKAERKDHRKRVIRAYHKASYKLIDHGAKSAKDMTPGEFEKASKYKLELKDESLDELTDLYEEARYSEHEISLRKSENAEKHLDSIEKELTSPKEEEENDG
ncbi:MAG: DUF4129 domain-containing protein [Candidatus Heimdallarchaeota archaeon]